MQDTGQDIIMGIQEVIGALRYTGLIITADLMAVRESAPGLHPSCAVHFAGVEVYSIR
jgi:hypothetical protein